MSFNMLYPHYILDENGEPVPEYDLHVWSKWFEEHDRRVALDMVNGYRVSTVFLSIDHNFGVEGKPILWETMIFGGSDGDECYCERYSSLHDAQEGHKRIVEKLQSG